MSQFHFLIVGAQVTLDTTPSHTDLVVDDLYTKLMKDTQLPPCIVAQLEFTCSNKTGAAATVTYSFLRTDGSVLQTGTFSANTGTYITKGVNLEWAPASTSDHLHLQLSVDADTVKVVPKITVKNI